MAWYGYEFWGSTDGHSWQEVRPVLSPHPEWRVQQAIDFAGTVVTQPPLSAFPLVRLRRRVGTYRPKGQWRIVAEWRNGAQVEVPE